MATLTPVSPSQSATSVVSCADYWQNLSNSFLQWRYSTPATTFVTSTVSATDDTLTISGAKFCAHYLTGLATDPASELSETAFLEFARIGRPSAPKWMTADISTPNVVVLTLSSTYVPTGYRMPDHAQRGGSF